MSENEWLKPIEDMLNESNLSDADEAFQRRRVALMKDAFQELSDDELIQYAESNKSLMLPLNKILQKKNNAIVKSIIQEEFLRAQIAGYTMEKRGIDTEQIDDVEPL